MGCQLDYELIFDRVVATFPIAKFEPFRLCGPSDTTRQTMPNLNRNVLAQLVW